MKTFKVEYHFTMTNGTKRSFTLKILEKTLETTGTGTGNMPWWTALDFHQCPNCPFLLSHRPDCPVATGITAIIGPFENMQSYDEIHVKVVTRERTISQTTTVQQGISALMGLIMATSGCPHFAFFKPMARFHLPLASDTETIYRATSMYMLAQYFKKKENMLPDLEFNNLIKIYQDIETVNSGMIERLRAMCESDSCVNAVVILDAYAKTLPFAIEEYLDEIKYMFEPYLQNG